MHQSKVFLESSRLMGIFIGQPRNKERDTKGSLIDYELHKIKRTVLSTTVAELYALMKCYGSRSSLRTDVNNLVTRCLNTPARTKGNNPYDSNAETGSLQWSDA